jgi:serine/threonine protein kinase
MASANSSHQFQKLKLDTSAPHKPVASSFASIPRNDAQQTSLLKPDGHDNDVRSLHPNDDVLRCLHLDSTDGRTNGHGLPYDVASTVVDNHDGDVEARFRKRTTCVSFDDLVTLDGGNRLPLDKPLPRFATAPGSFADNAPDDPTHINGFVDIGVNNKARLQHQPGEPRCPPLDTAAHDEPQYPDHVASLTSDTTISPVLEEAPTPPDTPQQYYLSPSAASSPIEFPSLSSSRRIAPQRTRSFRSEADGDGSFSKRSSRRSSTRSGRSMSSASPAASFLSKWTSGGAPLKPPQPDDEGQGIGFEGEYIIGKQIGYGGFSVVKEVTSIEDGKSVVQAVKIVRKQLGGKSELENEQIQTQFEHEVGIWRYLHHPYILPLLRVYNTEFATFCITRLNKGGTLFDLVRDAHRNKRKGIDARLAKRYTYQLASAIRYLHRDVMVVHRDIKLENCLIDKSGPNAEQEGGDVLLCDFGMADFIVSDQRDGPEPSPIGDNRNVGPANTSSSVTSSSVTGSLQYAAPELFDADTPLFSPAADVWAFGVVVYCLLTAQLPFNEGLDAKTMMKIKKGDWDVEKIRCADAVKEGGLDDALELLKGCLNLDPQQRWTVNDILACSWLEGCAQACETQTCENVPHI